MAPECEPQTGTVANRTVHEGSLNPVASPGRGLADAIPFTGRADTRDRPVEFVRIDAAARLLLPRPEGRDIGPEDFDEELRAYLPEALFE